MSDNSEFGGIRSAHQIASLMTLQMVKSETHLDGDILNDAAPGTQCRHVWDNAIDELGEVSRPNWQRMSLVWRIKAGFFQHWQGAAALRAHVFAPEELLARPETVLRGLKHALGLRFEQAMLDRAGIYTGRSQGKFIWTRQIDRLSANGWCDRLSPEQQAGILNVAGLVVKELRYA